MAIKFLNTVQVDTDVLYVDASSNNVGIGTTSPSTKLHISDASTPEVRIQDTTNNRYLSLFQNDSNSYIQSSLNSALVLLTHGANERMRITTAGNVGIGTTSPGSKLTVDGTTRLGGDVEVSELLTGDRVLTLTANGGSFEIGDIDGLGDQAFISGDGSSISISTNQITTLYCDSNNRVGIGTTNPLAKTHIKASNAGGDSAASGTLIVEQGSAPSIQLLSANSQTQTIKFADPQSSQIGRISYSHPNDAMFFVTNGSERMRIDSSGNIGIGTTSPGEKLAVKGDASYIEITHPTATSYSGMKFSEGGTPQGSIQNIGSTFATVARRGNFEIFHNTGGNLTLQHSGGNVGIGTTSPRSKLHVEGVTGSVPALGAAASAAQIGGSTYGTLFSTLTSGTGVIQQGRSDGATLTFPLLINPNGGNVGIGTTSLTTISSAVATLSLGSTSASTSGGIAFQANGVVKAYNYVASNYLYNQTVASIGQIFFGAGSERMRIHNTTGNVGIGTTSPNSKLHVAGTVSLSTPLANFNGSVGSGTYGAVSVRVDNINYGTAMKFYRSLTADNNAIGFQNGASTVGSISIGASSTSYNTTSDYRLKENLTAITDGIDRLKQLKPRRFNFIGNADVVDGFIAHEAKEVIPESVTGEKDEVLPNGDPVYQGIDQAKIVPLLTAALQEAISKIEQLETRIQTLENK